MSNQKINRRDFIKRSGIGASSLFIPWHIEKVFSGKNQVVRFGLCADVHKDIMHDADERLGVFIAKMNKEKVDFILQLGDFCRPYGYNNSFMEIWNQFGDARHHVLGNHDMDGGFTREQTLEYWGAKSKYYSFDCGNFHFIVLDGNDKNPSENRAAGYARYIGEKQRKWLKNDLAKTKLQTFIFSHQSLENKNGVENNDQVRNILEKTNEESGFLKVVACFSGHHHIDFHTEINGIKYIQINSMSYQWLGKDFLHVRYSKEIDEKFPWIKYTTPHKDPLFALVTVDQKRIIKIEGVTSEFVGPSPWKLGYPEKGNKEKMVPKISDKTMRFHSHR